MSTTMISTLTMRETASSGRRRRNRIALGAALAMCAATLTLTAAPASLAAENETTVTHTPVAWVIAGGPSCDQLEVGEVITGEGTITNRIVSHTGRDGLTTVHWYQIANGSAVDQNGHRYRWVYKNHENLVNSLANPLLYTGTMTDSFNLVGGPLAFSNGFIGTVTDDLGNLGGIFIVVPTSVTGDPLEFPSGPGRCDPI
jgi:hypothetical protein